MDARRKQLTRDDVRCLHEAAVERSSIRGARLLACKHANRRSLVSLTLAHDEVPGSLVSASTRLSGGMKTRRSASTWAGSTRGISTQVAYRLMSR
jgi:hypothetical protein